MFKPKTAKQDYGRSMLPKTRKEVFKDVVKLNWLKIIFYGFLTLAISLPLHISAFLSFMYSAQISAMLGAGNITPVQAVSMRYSSELTFALIDVLLFVLFAVFFSGLAHVIRQHVWEESVFFRYDYMKGIKQNGASFALLGFLVGIVRLFCIWFPNMLMLHGGNSYYYAGYIPVAWFAVMLAPPAAYMTVCIPIYGVKFHQNAKTAFMLYFKNFFKTVGAVLLCAVIFIPQMIPNFWCMILGRILSSIAVPFIMLGFTAFSYNILDKSFNPKFYPQLVGKGLYKDEKESDS